MDSIDSLPLIGGSPALDLVNTRQRGIPLPGGSNHDYLQSPGDLVAWSRRVGLIGADEARRVRSEYARSPAEAEQALSTVRLVREALYAALLATLAGPQGDDDVRPALDVLHQQWVRAIGRSHLDLSQPAADPIADPGLDHRLRVGTDGTHAVIDRIAVAAVEALRAIDPKKLRQCPVDAGGCGWLFVDRSRNGSRRWCRMADCGTQVKSRRLTERRRETSPTPARRPTRTH
jgi:predicted RNA-binding Zn ribbon-like protein